jgi:hypothetical protein
MRSLPVYLGRGLGIALGVIVTTMAQGQTIVVARAEQNQAPPPVAKPPAGSVHRMVILQGSQRTVHYITTGNLSSADTLAAYQLERAENDLAYVKDLQRLKGLYAHNERLMEPQRLYVQEQLYGTQIRYGGTSAGYGRTGYSGGWGTGGLYTPYGYVTGYGYPGATVGYLGSSWGSVTRSLQFGMGDEGRVKTALAPVLAHDASPDYAAAAVRAYDAAVARASASPVLSRDLGLPKSASAPKGQPSSPKGSKASPR